MEETVLEAIKRFDLLSGSRNVTVALSGGADSMSLLYVLRSLSEKLGITVSAAHLNHMIRGEEAMRDENFVRNECEKLGIEFFCERVDIPAYAKKTKQSTELAAREVRYEFLGRVSKGVVATAHTASDNLETMIFNLTRGSSLKGLCGIPTKRDIFIRPLILCTRQDVEKYCSDNGISYVTDSTNLSDEYTRNKIRHNITPVLKEINPLAESAAVRTAALLSEDEKYLSGLAEDFISENLSGNRLKTDKFEKLPRSVAFRVIKKYAEDRIPDTVLDNRHIYDIYSVCQKGGRTSLPSGFNAEVRNDFLRVIKPENYVYSVEKSTESIEKFKNNRKINNLLLKNSLDCDKIIGKSVIRTRLPGDSIRLKNRGCTKSLKKLYNECEIPLYERESIPVISDDKGVVWIFGIGVAHRCAVTESTKNVMVIEAQKSKKI